MASLLAQTRRESDGALASSHPELTIEPIFRSTPAQSPAAAESDFDQSMGGRRISAYYDSDGKHRNVSCHVSPFFVSGRLGIKTVSESPEIRNLSERGDSEDLEEMGSEAEGTEGESCLWQLSQGPPSTTQGLCFEIRNHRHLA